MNAAAARFTAEQRDDTWTVGDHLVVPVTGYLAPEPWRWIKHGARWPKETALKIAEVLNAHPYHADEWEWEA